MFSKQLKTHFEWWLRWMLHLRDDEGAVMFDRDGIIVYTFDAESYAACLELGIAAVMCINGSGVLSNPAWYRDNESHPQHQYIQNFKRAGYFKTCLFTALLQLGASQIHIELDVILLQRFSLQRFIADSDVACVSLNCPPFGGANMGLLYIKAVGEMLQLFEHMRAEQERSHKPWDQGMFSNYLQTKRSRELRWQAHVPTCPLGLPSGQHSNWQCMQHLLNETRASPTGLAGVLADPENKRESCHMSGKSWEERFAFLQDAGFLALMNMTQPTQVSPATPTRIETAGGDAALSRADAGAATAGEVENRVAAALTHQTDRPATAIPSTAIPATSAPPASQDLEPLKAVLRDALQHAGALPVTPSSRLPVTTMFSKQLKTHFEWWLRWMLHLRDDEGAVMFDRDGIIVYTFDAESYAACLELGIAAVMCINGSGVLSNPAWYRDNESHPQHQYIQNFKRAGYFKTCLFTALLQLGASQIHIELDVILLQRFSLQRFIADSDVACVSLNCPPFGGANMGLLYIKAVGEMLQLFEHMRAEQERSHKPWDQGMFSNYLQTKRSRELRWQAHVPTCPLGLPSGQHSNWQCMQHLLNETRASPTGLAGVLADPENKRESCHMSGKSWEERFAFLQDAGFLALMNMTAS